ncbi:MAG: BrnA antitoxin family protein [Spirochaetales bacterium]|nr:BrnA antitoxin family protein [Spirochaetales bacterium]
MKKKHISHKSQTDWDHVDKLRDKDIDFSDIPEVTPEMFAKAVVRKGLKPVVHKTQITLRIDDEVLTWFRKQGRGYQTRINSLLKAYKEAHQNNEIRPTGMNRNS